MNVDNAFIWNIFLEYIIKIIVLGIIVGLIVELIIKMIEFRKVKEKYFEFYKKLDDISPSDFNIAEYKNYYYHSKENDLIIEALNKGSNVIITGKPKAGKTRAAYESLIKLNTFKIIKFWPSRQIDLEDIPNWLLKDKILIKSKIVVFIDDLDKYVDKLDINHLLKKLDLNTKEFQIVATCRTGTEYNYVKREFNESIRNFKVIELRDIDKVIAKDLSAKYGLNYEDYDGTIGSIFLGLEDMYNRYDGLSDEYHVLFRIIKLFSDANTFIIDKNILNEVYLKKIGKELIPRISFDTMIENLEENSLIIQKKGTVQIAHDCYLDFANYNASTNDLLWLREILIEKNYIDGLFDIAVTFNNNNLYEDSLICINAILRTTEDYFALNNRGIILQSLERLEESLESFNMAIKLDPHLEIAYKGKCDTLRFMGKFKEGIKCCDKSLEINPEYYKGHISKGNILADLKKFDDALACFDRAIKIDPKNTGAFYNKGVTLMELKRLDDALACFNDALKIDPHDFDSLAAKGQTLMDLGKPDEALCCFNESLKVNFKGKDNDEMALNNKAVALNILNRKKEGMEYLNKVLKINPNNEKALMSRAMELYENGEYNKSIIDYNRLIRINPNNKKALINKGVVLAEMGKYEEAIINYDKVLEMNQSDKSVLFNKGNSLFYLNKYDDALECFKNILKLNPTKKPTKNQVLKNMNSVLTNLGNQCITSEKYDEALDYCNKILENDSKNINAWFMKGFALWALGHTEDALNSLDETLKINPTFEPALEFKKSILEI